MKIKLLSILSFCLLFTGCASVKHQVPVDYSTVPVDGNTIAISFKAPSKPKMTTPGAACLLCLAVAAAANSGLTTHTKSLNSDEISSLGIDINEILKANDYSTNLLTEPVDFKKLKKTKDPIEPADPVLNHTPLKQTLGATHLLKININYVGFVRDYSNYVPLTPPYSLVW